MPDTFIDLFNKLGNINNSYWYLMIERSDSLEMVMLRSQEWMKMGIKMRSHLKSKIKMLTIKRIKRRYTPIKRTKPFNNPPK